LVSGPVPGLDGALALARSEPLDAAILDVNLSGSRSEAVANTRRERAIPLIVLTGYADSGLSAAHRAVRSSRESPMSSTPDAGS
jgi:CheY-like chemotaxis protein